LGKGDHWGKGKKGGGGGLPRKKSRRLKKSQLRAENVQAKEMEGKENRQEKPIGLMSSAGTRARRRFEKIL